MAVTAVEIQADTRMERQDPERNHGDERGKMNGLIIHYEEYGAQLGMLNAEQLGMLLKSLISVAQGGDPSSDMDALTLMCFQFMKDRMIRDQELSEKRAKARRKDPSETTQEQTETKNNKTEQNETPIPIPITNTNTKEKDICASDPDSAEAEDLFQKLWKMYPNKKGLGAVKKSQKLKLFREVGADHLTRALNRYLEEHKKKEQRGDFCPPWKNGSTWFNSGYLDYLDENYQPAPADPPKRSGTGSGLLNFEQSGTDYDAIADQLWMEELEGSGDG